MPESRGKAQETAARRDGAGTARGWPVCISGVSVQAERSERPSVVVSKEFEGNAKGIRILFIERLGVSRPSFVPDPASRFTNAAPNSARRNFYVPSATTARAIGALNSTASCTKRDKSASPRTSLATICCPRAGPKRPTKTPGAQALGANSPRSSARRCAYTDINALRPWRVRPKTRRPLRPGRKGSTVERKALRSCIPMSASPATQHKGPKAQEVRVHERVRQERAMPVKQNCFARWKVL